MVENLTKGEIKSVVEDLVEELRECPDGTRITTALLLRQAGHEEEFDMNGRFFLGNTVSIVLPRVCHKNHCKRRFQGEIRRT